METNNSEDVFMEDAGNANPVSRPSAKKAQNRSRKTAMIGIGITAAVVCVGLAIILTLQALSFQSGNVENKGYEDPAITASESADISEEEEPGITDDYLQQEYVPPKNHKSLKDDPRLKKSSGDNTTIPKNRVVYLTFDDGPSDLTPSILKTLEKYNVKATWFVTGTNNNLDNLKKIWKAGHQVGLHSNSHNYKKIYKTAGAFFADMDELVEKVHKRIGVAPKLIRFPGGSINSYNNKTRAKIIKELKSRKWHYFDWNASADDAVSPKMRSSKKIIASVKKSSSDKHSVCLLMHDTNSKKSTVKSLDKIIKYYKKKGFKFKYLDAESYGYHF